MASAREHWEAIWRDRDVDEMSWHQARPARSLELVRSVSAPDDAVIDVGGGASTLVDELLVAGYRGVTVLDVSGEALAVARERLGPDEARVDWVVADVLTADLARTYDVWHDRAVFHFLVDAADRLRYVEAMARAVVPGGHAVVATFGPRGPTSCSGLPVRRYDRAAMSGALGAHFELLSYVEEEHVTPGGTSQQFAYGLLVRRGDGGSRRAS